MELEMYGVAAVPLIIAAVAVLKSAGLPSQFAGLAAVIFGLALGGAFGATAGWSPVQSVVTGLGLGLSAAGLYSTQKNARGL